MVNRGKPICYYGLWKSTDGGFGFEVMSKEDVEKHGRKYSKSYNSGPWQTEFNAMAEKTVLKKALKNAPLKAEVMAQIMNDESIKTSIDEDMSTVPNEFYDADTTVFDADTGEVIG
jgi:recombination protein RecT